MPLTLEEARTLDAFSRLGSIARAAGALRKANSAVVYSLASIETKTGLKVFDRSGYRTRLLPAGQRLLEGCRRLLEAEKELGKLCTELVSGWEADLRIIVDGVVPLAPVLGAVKLLSTRNIPTRVRVITEFLGDVEAAFVESGAELMISVLAPERTTLEPTRLAPVPALLVAHRSHPLFESRHRIQAETLLRYPMLTVRGSDPRLNMSTAAIESGSLIQLNDFHSKKAALLTGLGFGWMPRYLIEDELASGKLKVISWARSNQHVFRPYLYHRGPHHLGRAASLFIKEMTH